MSNACLLPLCCEQNGIVEHAICVCLNIFSDNRRKLKVRIHMLTNILNAQSISNMWKNP